jgi:hypothetical protein
VPLAGKRIADVGTGIGHYPMLLARTPATPTVSSPIACGEARRRATIAPAQPAHHGGSRAPARRGGGRGAVEPIEPRDASLPAIAGAACAAGPGAAVVIGYYGRDGAPATRTGDCRPRRDHRAPAGSAPRFRQVVHSRVDLSMHGSNHPAACAATAREPCWPRHPASSAQLGLYHRAGASVWAAALKSCGTLIGLCFAAESSSPPGAWPSACLAPDRCDNASRQTPLRQPPPARRRGQHMSMRRPTSRWPPPLPR